MTKKKYCKLKRSDDLILELPEGWGKEGEKVSIDIEGDSIVISKFASLDLDMDDDMFLSIAKQAHEKDITFNEMVCELLTKFIDDNKKILEEDFPERSAL
jgi:hypothetical protein